jgi:tRNA threonylcarbamoyladenosine biosynthesis protein TsaB
VGLSAVKGMAFAAGKPVIGASSLDLLAMNVAGDAQVCAVNDARRGLVYACLYEKKGGALKKKTDYLLTDIHSVLKQIKGGVVFVGDGLKLYKEDIKKTKGLTPVFTEEKDSFPQAGRLPSLVLQRARQNEWDPVDALVPLYLYPDHCQIRKR